jgi:hypothetical protein
MVSEPDWTNVSRIHEERIHQVEVDLKGGDGGGTSGDMERRVTKLEEKVDKLIDRATAVEVNLATLTERVAHLPGKGFIVGSTLTTLAVIAALTAYGEKLQHLVN